MLHDPLTGLPGHALLLDRLDQALIRARTRGTLVSLVLVRVDDGLIDVAHALRDGLRADFTVARYQDRTLAVVAEHAFGDGEPVAERIKELAPKAHIHWVTSDGDTTTDDVLAFAKVPEKG
ncbi:diguanylate cyclase [Lentzea tibetensis]|uniref:Diguanylate cyclase n=1 Tax=Lentzea tibetensis TaxID=2591470 RepID=A0A563EZD4_9PSEU|nr:diguanylate cyclase [Lentzea tibetensis]TWP52888.1 diguanylate cyclase [Lentzea tibetensis]